MPRSRLIIALFLLPISLVGCTIGRHPSVPLESLDSGCECDWLTNVGDRVFFAFDSTTLSKDKSSSIEGSALMADCASADGLYANAACPKIRSSQTTLNLQAAWLSRWLPKYPSVKLLVAGNTDERGPETYNLALGQRRADVVRDYLVAKGISPRQITTISYGKERPVATGHDEIAWQQNRNAITSWPGYNPQMPKTPPSPGTPAL